MKCSGNVQADHRRLTSYQTFVAARRRPLGRGHVVRSTDRRGETDPQPGPVPNPSPGPGPSASPSPGPSLTDPVQTIAWGGTLPSTRRAVLGGLSGVTIALGGNLGGVTSWLLGLDGGQLAGRLRADVLVPVRGIKRHVDYTYGFEFTYPTAWLGDQTLAYRAAKRAEEERGGLPGYDDYGFPSPSGAYGRGPSGGGVNPAVLAAARRQRAAAPVAEPVAAFGPPGTTGEENVSVIVAPITPGFSLQSLGDPRDAAGRFLSTLAPEGSGLTARLVAAEGRNVALPGGSGRPTGQGPQEQLYYTLEYTVQGPKFFRHNVSVYTARNDLLYTFNAQCPEARWTEDAAPLQASAASFRLF